MTHPARFSPEVIDAVAEFLIHRWPPDLLAMPILHDPFAGSGERLAELAQRCAASYSGTEIEQCLIVASGITCGDATNTFTYPTRPYVIFTSPAYPNGMADHFHARDDSVRKTYRKAVAEIEGQDRELHENNQGRWGYRGTRRHGTSKRRIRYWEIASKAVACWGSAELVLLNVSDYKHSNGQVEPVVQDWRDLLKSYGWARQTLIPVGTKRMRNGANRDERVDVEMIVVAER